MVFEALVFRSLDHQSLNHRNTAGFSGKGKSSSASTREVPTMLTFQREEGP